MALLVTRVATNEPLDACERAIGVIQDEHRSIAVVVRGIQDLVDEAETSRCNLDIVSLEPMLNYLQQYPLRVHHPKEEAFLHAKLRLRLPESEALLRELGNC